MKHSQPSVIFITFADGSDSFQDAGKRLAQQARNSGVFSKVVTLTDKDLLAISTDWQLAHKKADKEGLFPHFYLGAKAWVIKEALDGIFGHFDIVFYADAGCEILNNKVAIYRIRKILKKIKDFGGMAEQLAYSEEMYTKKSLMDYLELSDTEKKSGQIQATWSVWAATEKSKSIASEWVSISNLDLGLWQNPKPNELNLESANYIDHRRDQSIFSILWKRANYRVKTPYWEQGGRLGKIRGCSNFLHTSRNRTGETYFKKYQENLLVGVFAIFLNKLFEIRRKFLK
jgi:hypothetical protein